MVIKRSVVIILLIIALIVGFDIYRTRSGSFTVIRNEDYVAPQRDDGIVNINTANIDELTELEGIGKKIAERIVAYRTKKPFTDVRELMNVDGIGINKFEKIKDKIKVE